MQHSKSANIALLRFVGVIYSFAVDLVFFKEKFNWLQVLAVLLILVTNVITAVYKIKQEKHKPPEQPVASEVEIAENESLLGRVPPASKTTSIN